MAVGFPTWTVLPHGPIERLETNLARVEGSLPGDPPLRRAMTVVRLDDGRLVFYSAIALDDARMRELEAWGTPAFLVVPNDRHRLDAHAYKQRYPGLHVLCPPGARARVEQAVPVDATAAAFGDDAVTWEVLEGTGEREVALVVRSGARASVVVCDAVMNNRRFAGVKGFVLNTLGFSGARPKVVPATRMALVRDRAAFRAHLARLAATPGLSRVIVGHGAVVTEAPAAALGEVAAAL